MWRVLRPVGLRNVTIVEVLESRQVAHIVEATIAGSMADSKLLESQFWGSTLTGRNPSSQNHFNDGALITLSLPDHDCWRWWPSQRVCRGRSWPDQATSKLTVQDWPGAARWAGEERLRGQFQKLEVPSKPMVPLGERVVVKAKWWHKKGPLAAPFKPMVLMGPSPTMTNGWVLR